MYHSQWKEVVFVVVLNIMDLTDCHRVAIPEDPMCGQYAIRKGHGHEAIYNFVKETELDGPQVVSLQVSASPTETAIR